MATTNSNQKIDDRNHCPMGCEKWELDEHGYCAHLVGFTNRGKLMETIAYNDRGFIQVRHDLVAPVEKGDKLVNPEKVIHDQAGSHVMQEWVSARVYRKKTAEEVDAWQKAHLPPISEETMELAEQV